MIKFQPDMPKFRELFSTPDGFRQGVATAKLLAGHYADIDANHLALDVTGNTDLPYDGHLLGLGKSFPIDGEPRKPLVTVVRLNAYKDAGLHQQIVQQRHHILGYPLDADFHPLDQASLTGHPSAYRGHLRAVVAQAAPGEKIFVLGSGALVTVPTDNGLLPSMQKFFTPVMDGAEPDGAQFLTMKTRMQKHVSYLFGKGFLPYATLGEVTAVCAHPEARLGVTEPLYHTILQDGRKMGVDAYFGSFTVNLAGSGHDNSLHAVQASLAEGFDGVIRPDRVFIRRFHHRFDPSQTLVILREYFDTHTNLGRAALAKAKAIPGAIPFRDWVDNFPQHLKRLGAITEGLGRVRDYGIKPQVWDFVLTNAGPKLYKHISTKGNAWVRTSLAMAATFISAVSLFGENSANNPSS